MNDSAAPVAVRGQDLAPDTEREPITLRCPQSERDSWGRGTTTDNVLPPSARSACTR